MSLIRKRCNSRKKAKDWERQFIEAIRKDAQDLLRNYRVEQ